MECKYCGAKIDGDMNRCPNCGALLESYADDKVTLINGQPIENYVNQAEEQQNYQYQSPPGNGAWQNQQPNPGAWQNQPGGPVWQNPVQQPEPGMKWYKFLIYFALFASAVICFKNAFDYFSGNVYGDSKDMVYIYFPAARFADYLYGAASAVIAVLALVCRQALAKFRRNGPGLVLIIYAANAVSMLVYVLLVHFIVGMGSEVWISTISGTLSSVLMIVLNNIYFKKRRHLFVN